MMRWCTGFPGIARFRGAICSSSISRRRRMATDSAVSVEVTPGKGNEREVRRRGFHVVRELGGHGIGRTIHEPPSVPNYADSSAQHKLTVGLVITIERRSLPQARGMFRWTRMAGPTALRMGVSRPITSTPLLYRGARHSCLRLADCGTMNLHR